MRRSATPPHARARNRQTPQLSGPLCVLLLLLLSCPPALAQQAGTIAGRVTDAGTGEPIPGVNVVVENSTLGASTDVDGLYRIVGVEPGTYTLVASFVGYGDEAEEGVEVRDAQTTTVDFALQAGALGLDELVVVGYGTQQRRDITGAISTVSPDDLQQIAVTSLDQGLQGQVAGMQVTQVSGAPGAAPQIRIRGGTSINAGNNPLYVIDGFPVYGTRSMSTGATQGGEVNPLATINPSDIESIQVLKDASATAIYGARGANGVVVITTRDGSARNARVSFNSSVGVQNVRKTIDVLDAMEFAELTNVAYTNSGNDPFFSEEDMAQIRQNGGTDWQDEIFQAAPVQDYGLSVSGGTDAVRYALSGGYLSQDGIVIGSDFERISLRANLDSDISARFRMGSNLSVSRTDADLARTPAAGGGGGGIIYGALFFNPAQPVFEPDGSYVLQNSTGILLGNPVAQAREITNNETATRFLGTLFGEFDLTDRLTARVSVGGDLYNNKEDFYAPSTVLQGSSRNGVAELGQITSETWLNENTLSYNRVVGAHTLDLLAGFTAQAAREERFTASSEQFASDALRASNLSAGSVVNIPGSGVVEWGLLSYIGRVNYGFGGRYLLTATARVDGSSRFGEGNKYGFFPSGAFAWRIDQEEFARGIEALDNLKLRLSYGVTGNQEIGTYRSLALLNDVKGVLGSSVRTGFAAARVANPDLRWETTRQFDAGLDVGLFNNRISATLDVYNKTTTDLLLEVPIPWTSGFAASLQNLGSLRNRGFELALDARLAERPLLWTTRFNVGVNRNEVLDLGPLDQFLDGANNGHLKVGNNVIVRPGEPIGAFYGLIREGIFRSEEEVAASAQPDAEPGQTRYRDLDGDGTIGPEDRTVIGYAQPDFSGGFSTNLAYKSFELSANLSFVYGNEIFNVNRMELLLPTGGQNNSVEALDYWSPENPDAAVPRPSRARALDFSDWYLEDGSYLRLQNLTLAYNVPPSLLPAIRTRSARVFVSGKNLVTFTGYSGYDPELRQYAGNNLALGYDYGTYPTARTYTVGVSLGF